MVIIGQLVIILILNCVANLEKNIFRGKTLASQDKNRGTYSL